MKQVASFFIKNSKFTIVLSFGALIFGLQGLSNMNSESYPAVDFAQATVVTPYEGASAEDIETKITKPIEDEIRSVSGIKDVKSVSQTGLSTIVIRADIDKVDDVQNVMADLQRAVDRASGLPTDLQEDPIFTEIKSEEFPVLEIAVVGSNENRLRDLVADALKEDLEDNKKVKSARLTGYAPRRFQVKLDRKKLIQYHIGINEVLEKINQRNVSIPGGNLKSDTSQFLVRLEGKVQNAKDLGNILVRSNFVGKKIYLKDIAEVRDSEEEIKTKTRYNGEEATLVIVTKKGGSDTISLVSEVEGKIEDFREKYKDQLKFKIYNNESAKVENRLDVLTSNALSGLVIVVIFLLIFLPGRIGIMASFSLPIAILITAGVMPMFGMNLNAITILALVIALGMLVDNSVVIAENFARLKDEGYTTMDAATESISTLWLPISATAFTTIAAFLPMLVTKGIMGEFIKWIPVVVTIALLASLFESFFFLPMRLVAISKDKSPNKSANEAESKKADWFSSLQNLFEKFMTVCVKFRYVMVLFFFMTVGVSIYFMTVANKFILFPPDQTEIYLARIEAKTGTKLDDMYTIVEKLSKDVKESLGDDVAHIVGRAGASSMGPTDPKAQEGDNVGMLTLYVTEDAKYNLSHIEALKKLRKIDYKKYVDDVEFEALINGPPVGNDIEATLRSNSLKEIDIVAQKIINELSKINGVSDLKVADVFGDNEIFVDIDYPKADRLGLGVRSIGNTIKTAVNGQIISTVTLENKDVDIMVRALPKDRRDIKDLESLLVMDNRGNLVELGTFAKFEEKKGSPQIKRFDFKRSKTLTGNVNDELVTSVEANKKLEEVFNKVSKDHPSVSLVFGGAAESTKESMDSLFSALILSLIGIAALLVFLFSSYLRPFIIMTTIPLGLLGFSIAFWIEGIPISFLALIGIIGLGGIIVNSGIVLISFIDQMKEEGKIPLDDILVKASGMRLKAVLVTSLTTISGLMPTAYGIGGTDSMLVPMTKAMAWGLTSGTILTLIWVPCAYAILEDVTGLKLFSRLKNSISSNVLRKKEA